MSSDADSRTTPVRDDLVAATLAARYPGRRAVKGIAHRAVAPTLTLSFAPSAEARQESELLFGEPFTVYEQAGGWAWGQAGLDGYVGYAPAAGLTAEVVAPTHVVAAAASHGYPAPDPKRRPLYRLSLGSLVRVTACRDGYAEIAGGGWLFARHLAPVGEVEPDYIATARRLLGVPYLWGGRSAAGLDCSGLVQLALGHAGMACPRDSDMQERALGEAVPSGTHEAWRRGDLVFFPGHVGIVTDNGRFLHANAFAMMVTEEPLADVLDRARASGAGVSAVRRLTQAQ